LQINTKARLINVQKEISESSFDTFMVLIGENRRYISGYTADDGQFDETAGILLITEEKALLLTDSRYDLQATREAPHFEVIRYEKGLFKELPDIVKSLNTQAIGFESVRLSYAHYLKITSAFKDTDIDVKMVPVEDLVENFRLQKDEQEILIIKKALNLSETVFLDFIHSIKPGVTEKSLAWLLEAKLKEAGAEGLSFPAIVASGPNSAMPHAEPTDRKIQVGEPIMFDFGIRMDGYCSDMTRMAILGEPDDMYRKVYETVLHAQQKATQTIKAGVSSKAVDAVARDHIDAQGFKGKFGHGLGHGVGLAIHEAPRLSPLSETPLKAQTIVTVEPGIYLPDWGGIRLENMVAVREDGADVLNKTDPADMIIISN
jgi:Xaa-Pro aminopeptidase